MGKAHGRSLNKIRLSLERQIFYARMSIKGLLHNFTHFWAQFLPQFFHFKNSTFNKLKLIPIEFSVHSVYLFSQLTFVIVWFMSNRNNSHWLHATYVPFMGHNMNWYDIWASLVMLNVTFFPYYSRSVGMGSVGSKEPIIFWTEGSETHQLWR